jgi:putative NADPH-quinone reductase
MRWQEPIVVHGTHRIDDAELREHAARYRARLATWASSHG